jgi:hypothetical protein
MQRSLFSLGILTALLAAVSSSLADVKVVVDRNGDPAATSAFKFERVPPPAADDAATKAKFSLVDGIRDSNSAELSALNDGKLPGEQDEPEANFFFDEGTNGGRIAVDLGRASDVAAVNTYSWHPNTRGPQVYKLYAADGSAAGFDAAPKNGADPEKAGWKLIASIDTRPKSGAMGGQYGVSIAEATGVLGRFRYLLFDISRTEGDDDFGNTFFSEIDVIEGGGAVPPATTRAAAIELQGKYVTIDVSAAPDLKDWAETKLLPTCDEWYPIIVKMLPSEGFTASDHFTIQFRTNMRRGIPAATGGGRVACNVEWFRRNMKGEALGAVVHEMVHVVQQYGAARRNNPNATQNPGWLVEGIADYIRWFKYEPQSHGADIRDASRAKYDASYRITANFLNFVTEKYDKDLVTKLNAACRQGKYSPELWKQITGKTAEELSEEWKQTLPHPATTRSS